MPLGLDAVAVDESVLCHVFICNIYLKAPLQDLRLYNIELKGDK